jgi:large subunit ribosomal protein L35
LGATLIRAISDIGRLEEVKLAATAAFGGGLLSEDGMPKLKTHKGAAKRFKKTATGKVKRGHAKLRHILTSKETKHKRKLGKSALVSDGDLPKVLRMIPYQ